MALVKDDWYRCLNCEFTTSQKDHDCGVTGCGFRVGRFTYEPKYEFRESAEEKRKGSRDLLIYGGLILVILFSTVWAIISHH
jgi:hypothetical protein